MGNDKEIIKFEGVDEELEKKRGRPRLDRVTEAEKLDLARYALLGLAIIFIAGAAMFIFNKQAEIVFDTVKQVVPPIATLIFGYYFARK